MNTEDGAKAVYVPLLGRTLTMAQIDALMSLFAGEGWKLLNMILTERKQTLVKSGMAINVDDEIRAKARGEYAGIVNIQKLPEEIRESKMNPLEQPTIE